jgi:hypothetical protein
MITMLAADWLLFSVLLTIGLASVATILWMAWSATKAPKGDFVCGKCGLADPTIDGKCERCGLPVTLILRRREE